MNKAFEKILERLEEYKKKRKNCGNFYVSVTNDIIKIVHEVAEEYKDGWIPCSERLPDDDSICIVTVEYPNNETVVDYGWFDKKGICWYVGMQELRTANVLAWMPLPEPYKESDTNVK